MFYCQVGYCLLYRREGFVPDGLELFLLLDPLYSSQVSSFCLLFEREDLPKCPPRV